MQMLRWLTALAFLFGVPATAMAKKCQKAIKKGCPKGKKKMCTRKYQDVSHAKIADIPAFKKGLATFQACKGKAKTAAAKKACGATFRAMFLRIKKKMKFQKKKMCWGKWSCGPCQ